MQTNLLSKISTRHMICHKNLYELLTACFGINQNLSILNNVKRFGEMCMFVHSKVYSSKSKLTSFVNYDNLHQPMNSNLVPNSRSNTSYLLK
mmetsp:Transcript_26297/g.52384  ORF Transcript_26297/g.52384 Transcript_26297/m.52384 type:complete len:92 (-) Transcript_26297:733-1008(-)